MSEKLRVGMKVFRLIFWLFIALICLPFFYIYDLFNMTFRQEKYLDKLLHKPPPSGGGVSA